MKALSLEEVAWRWAGVEGSSLGQEVHKRLGNCEEPSQGLGHHEVFETHPQIWPRPGYVNG